MFNFNNPCRLPSQPPPSTRNAVFLLVFNIRVENIFLLKFH